MGASGTGGEVPRWDAQSGITLADTPKGDRPGGSRRQVVGGVVGVNPVSNIPRIRWS